MEVAMKKLEIVIRPEKIEVVKNILNDWGATGMMVTNIMGSVTRKVLPISIAEPSIPSTCYRNSKSRRWLPTKRRRKLLTSCARIFRPEHTETERSLCMMWRMLSGSGPGGRRCSPVNSMGSPSKRIGARKDSRRTNPLFIPRDE